MPTENYLICIVDHDAAVRRSIELLVRSAGYLTRTYPTTTDYLEHQPKSGNGCVLLDVRMPDISGLQLLEKLAQSSPEVPVVMMTGHGDVETAVTAMKLGAVEFLLKPFDDDALFAAIEEAQRRSGPTLRAGAAAAAARLAKLSHRESEILAALAAGRPQKVIAHELGISVRTVEVHRARMLRRLGVGSLAEAVRLSVLAGLDTGGDGTARVG